MPLPLRRPRPLLETAARPGESPLDVARRLGRSLPPALRFAPVGAPEAAIVGEPFGATNVPPTGAARLLSDLAPVIHTSEATAQDFAGISVPSDAKHANPRRVKVIATLCPDCGEPMTHEERQTSEDADGRCFQIACAGWGCDCGYFKADE